MGFTFGQRYVVANIPAAVAEAIEDGKVTRRYVTVVGKSTAPRRRSPRRSPRQFESHLDRAAVDLEKRRRDQDAQDPNYVARMRMRVLDGAGNEIDATSVDWQSDRTPNFTVRQDSGDGNCARQGAHRYAEPAFGLHARHQPQGILLG